MIVRTICFSCLDLSILEYINSQRRDLNLVNKYWTLSKFFGSKEFSSTSRKWHAISYCFPKGLDKVVQISFGVLYASMWNYRLGEIEMYRRLWTSSMQFKYLYFPTAKVHFVYMAMAIWYNPLPLSRCIILGFHSK
jgi:hypothetical protein